jgi:cytochrome b561
MPTSTEPLVYSSTARRLHWWTALFVAGLIPVGLYMAYRGNALNVWDATTNNLYGAHKAFGFLVLWLVVGRLVYRLMAGAPPSEPTLAGWQKGISHATHWSIYALLLIVPFLGWYGVSLYGATTIVGPIGLPSIAAQDQAAAARVLWWHGTLALTLAALIAMHVGAALMHLVVFRDGVFGRMWPSLKRAPAEPST